MKTRKKVVHKIVRVVIRSYEILSSIFMILVGDGSFKKWTKSFVNSGLKVMAKNILFWPQLLNPLIKHFQSQEFKISL